MDKPIRIALGDLRHKTKGMNSVFMPVGIGYIASYLLSRVDPDDVQIRMYNDPDVLLDDIDTWKPSVVGLANYCWNAELSRVVFEYARKINPGTFCIAGGPEFPVEDSECLAYLSHRREIDLYVYRYGEIPFANIITQLLAGVEISELKGHPQEGILSIDPVSSKLVKGQPVAHFSDLDVIPSPYLSGLMDQWFDGHYIASLETTRGCPFMCAYCYASQSCFSKIARFSVERIKAEISCIAERVQHIPDRLLLCDSNFGMHKRDEEIADHIRTLQDTYGWPKSISVTTGKENHHRILKIVSTVQNSICVSAAVQSLNPETLKIIKRKNLPPDKYRWLQQEIKDSGMISSAELIVPLPKETKDSFFEAVHSLIAHEIEWILTFTTMLLKGTPLASKEWRQKYSLMAKHRLLSRQFGTYRGVKCFELEEVCVATESLSFEDYLKCRGLAMVSWLIASKQFDIIRRHLSELQISSFDFLCSMLEQFVSGDHELSDVYRRFIEDTENELWDSYDVFYEHFSQPEMYDKLLSDELGDNLIRKYKGEVFLYHSIPLIKLAYTVIRKIAKDPTTEVLLSLAAAERWAIACRNVGDTIRKESFRADDTRILEIPYNVKKWYDRPERDKTLLSYKQKVKYRIVPRVKHFKRIIGEGERLYGSDPKERIGKLLDFYTVSDFWYESEVLDE